MPHISNKNTCDAERFEHNFGAIVADMFRLLGRDHAMTKARLSKLSGIHINTLTSWWDGGTKMPLWAFWHLAPYIPDDLLTLVSEAAGKAVVTLDDGGPGCLDTLGREAAGFVASYVDAKSDGVVTPHEKRALNNRRRKLAVVAGRAA